MIKVQEFTRKLHRRIKIRSESFAFSLPRPVDGRDLAPYFAEVTRAFEPFTNPFGYYQRLVDELLNIRELLVVPLYELLSTPTNGNRVIGLRHDVDNDPVTALRCARYLAQKGVCGSFYLLHIAPYYGEFYGDCFVRQPQLREWVRGFIVAGCEVGLHNDCLGVYNYHGLSGATALQQEIYWLSREGAVIRGTVAHSSGPAYGAENYEIFQGRQLWARTVRTVDRKWVPMGILRESSLGLSYEGTFAKPKATIDRIEAQRFFSDGSASDVRSEAWMRRYLLDNPCCDWDVDYQFWLLGKDSWVAAGNFEGARHFDWDIRLSQVVDLVRELPKNTKSIMVVHPEYVRGGR